MANQRFLGLDLSTQSLTAAVIAPDSGEIRQLSVNFDRDFPQYGTRGGVPPSEDPLRAYVDPRMWLEALDGLLGLLRESGLTPEIAAIAVSAQQHGTVYLNAGAEVRLNDLKPRQTLRAGLSPIFSRSTGPIWMDSSTGPECREITAALGGEREVARLTGSVATERFAGPQIRKFWKEAPEAYAETAHIAFISSFVTSVLAGRLAPADAGDGFGANLADVRAGAWSPAALAATAPGLAKRLPRLVTRDETIGRVSPFMAARFGFRPEAEVIVGSGDNPSSLAGLGLIGCAETHAVSLGTSDTYFGYIPRVPDFDHTQGHLFGAADGGAMFLVCFKNGSLAREKVKEAYGLSWDDVSQILLETAPGNDGRIMLPYVLPEITPVVLDPGIRRFGGLAAEDVKGNVRAVAEAQAISMFRHSAWTGPRPASILVTAGGSGNLGLLTVIAGVFGAEVRTLDVKDSAALGAAIRAAHAWRNRHGPPVTWPDICRTVVKARMGRVVRPGASTVRRYQAPGGLIDVHAACERFARGCGPDPQPVIAAFRAAFWKRQI